MRNFIVIYVHVITGTKIIQAVAYSRFAYNLRL